MEAVLTELAKQGPLGLVLVLFVWLYLKERQVNQDESTARLEAAKADAKSKADLANALEDVVEAVKVLGDNMERECIRTMVRLNELGTKAEGVWAREAEERAKAEGRREVTGRHVLADMEKE